MLGCAFLGSWRYLVAVTGSSLFFWDTERGQIMHKTDFPVALKSAALGLARDGQDNVLVIQDGKNHLAFRIIRAANE